MSDITSRLRRGSVVPFFLLSAAALVGNGSSAAAAVSAPSTSFAPPPGQVVDRSAFTTTSESSSGQMTTRSYPEPVNFQSGSGAWKPVDSTLEHAEDGFVHPADVDGDARIPSSLATPLKLTHDGRSLSLRLHGASEDPVGDRAVSGEKAVFDDAIDGVTVKYAARSQGLKETLVLATAVAPRSFSYDLAGDEDLAASIDVSGDLVLVDGAGKEKFRISAPLMWDSASPAQLSDALTLSVTKTSSGHWMLTMTASDSWLSDPARVYPVSVDPDFYWVNSSTQRFHGATQDCFLQSGSSANGNTCAFTQMIMGYINKASRPILRFDIGAGIPSGASITNAQLAMYVPGSGSQPAISSRVRALTADWDNNATWNSRKSATAWAAAGGDTSTATNLIGTANTTAGPAGYWYYWNVPTAAVQGWVSGTLPNYGIQVRADAETSATGQAIYFNSTESDQTTWPALDVTWTPRDSVAPPAPTNLEVETSDSVARTAEIDFDQADDTAQAGALASGLDHSEMRVSKRGGAYSAWAPTEKGRILITDVAEGDTVLIGVRTVDKAGNTSAAASNTFTSFVVNDLQQTEQTASNDFAAEFGVTYATASAWLASDDLAHEAMSSLEGTAAASHLAGMWFDNVARKIHFQVLDHGADAAIAVQTDYFGITTASQIDVVSYKRAALEGAAASFEQAEQTLIADGKVEVLVKQDLSGLSVTVGSTATSAEQARIALAGTSTGVAVSYTSVTGRVAAPLQPTSNGGSCEYTEPSPVYSNDPFPTLDPVWHWTDCLGTVRGGVHIVPADRGGSCSSAFTAVKNNGGDPYLLTAGHCFDEKGSADPTPSWSGAEWQLAAPTFAASERLGDAASMAYTGFYDPAANGISSTGEYEDVGAILLGQGVDGKPVADRIGPFVRNPLNSRKLTRVLGVESSTSPSSGLVPGQFVCDLGGRTGNQLAQNTAPGSQRVCNPVIDLQPDPAGNGHMVRFNSCGPRPGDSGSAIVTTDNLAAGIMSGTAYNTNAPSSDPATNYYQAQENAYDHLEAVHPGLALRTCPNGKRGYAVFTPADEDAAKLGMRILTTRWQDPTKALSHGDQVVRATLTWNRKTVDLDLHVWANTTGAHAYYNHPTAIAGGALFENHTGFGPEQFIEVPPATGSYTVGVCYYAGEGSAKFDLELRTADGEDHVVSGQLDSSGSSQVVGTTPTGGTVRAVPENFCQLSGGGGTGRDTFYS